MLEIIEPNFQSLSNQSLPAVFTFFHIFVLKVKQIWFLFLKKQSPETLVRAESLYYAIINVRDQIAHYNAFEFYISIVCEQQNNLQNIYSSAIGYIQDLGIMRDKRLTLFAHECVHEYSDLALAIVERRVAFAMLCGRL